jgi:hypothetical protein
MKIYRLNSEIYDIRPEDSSTRRVVHMGENVLNLTFKTTSVLDLRINDYVLFADEKYKFKRLVSPTRVSRHEFEYSCLLYSPQYDLQDAIYTLEDSTGVGILDDTIPLFGTASFHLAQIIKCARVVHPEWTAGDVEEPGEGKNIVYSDMDCLQALQHMCEEFNVEYWIVGTSVSIGKKKHGQPLVFRYGKGITLYDLSRQNLDGRIVTKLLVKGSDRNIDASTYGSKFLHLPGNSRYVERNTEKFGVIMGRMNFPDVYPRLIHKTNIDPGAVTSVRVDDDGIYYIKDNYLGFEPELLPGKNIVIDFQTGQMGGVRVDANWHSDTQEFELIKGDYGLGQEIPDSIFVPRVGDLYLLSDIKMPQQFIDAAEQELKEKAEEAISQLCEQKVSYKGTVNPLYFRQLNESVDTGRAVIVEDSAIVDGTGSVELRIQAFTENVNDDLGLEIEISDTLYISRLDRIESALQEVKLDTNEKIVYGDAYTRRRFRDAEETSEMLVNAQLHFSEAINPISVNAMQLLLGDKSLQFRFVNSKTNPSAISYLITYNKDTKKLRCPAAILQHMTLNINTLSSSHKANEYKFWDMSLFESSPLTVAAKKYYLYAKVSKSSTTGTFLLSETSIVMEGVSGYYHLLVGFLNSEYEGERSFVRMYGFSEFLPGQAFLDIISDPDRKTVIDLVNGTIRGNITITTGSTGYENLLDKPNLGVYETKADFKVFSDSITASVSRVSNTVDGHTSQLAQFQIFANNITATVTQTSNTVAGLVTQSAGWITQASGNTLWAKKEMENGSTIISTINQTAEAVTINASKINLTGKVTFSMLDTAAQTKINGKADTSSLGTMAGWSTIPAGTISVAMLGTTIIEGGYIKTSLINVDSIFANKAYLGNFTISEGWLTGYTTTGRSDGCITVTGPGTRVSIGHNLNPSTSGGVSTTALISNCNTKSIGAAYALELVANAGSSIPSVALKATGITQLRGMTSVVEGAMLNIAITADNLNWCRCYAYQPTSNTSIYLPSDSSIQSKFQYMANISAVDSAFIRIYILVTRWATANLYVQAASSSAPIVTRTGDTVSQIELNKGDCCAFTYYNRAWYLTFGNWDDAYM